MANPGRSCRDLRARHGPRHPSDHLAAVFERFHRVDVARWRERGGAGLGLAIGKWIAEAHGGEIRVDSSDTASTFMVTLPTS